MARFYGTVQGGRGEATRLGHANTGLNVSAQSYTGDIKVRMFVENGEDHCWIRVERHDGRGGGALIYRGPVKTLLEQSGRKTLVESFARDFLTGELEGQGVQ